MRVRILEIAEQDLEEGYHFYENQSPGLGEYFLDSLYAEIDSLAFYGGIHPVIYNNYRHLSKRFPFAVYYKIENDVVSVTSVLDCRRNPKWIRHQINRTN